MFLLSPSRDSPEASFPPLNTRLLRTSSFLLFRPSRGARTRSGFFFFFFFFLFFFFFPFFFFFRWVEPRVLLRRLARFALVLVMGGTLMSFGFMILAASRKSPLFAVNSCLFMTVHTCRTVSFLAPRRG